MVSQRNPSYEIISDLNPLAWFSFVFVVWDVPAPGIRTTPRETERRGVHLLQLLPYLTFTINAIALDVSFGSIVTRRNSVASGSRKEMKERRVSSRRNLNRRKFANIDFSEQVTPYMPKEKYFRRVASFDSLAGNEVLTSQPTFFYLLMLFPFAQK